MVATTIACGGGGGGDGRTSAADTGSTTSVGSTSVDTDGDTGSGGSDTADSTDTDDPATCEPACAVGQSCVDDGQGPYCTCAADPGACPSPTQCLPDGTCGGLVWPNDESNANSDPWISAHHDEITQMRPRVLAINYVNARSMQDMQAQLEEMVAVITESSRYHGYEDPDAPPFLAYELAYLVDARDPRPPADWPYNNSTLYPREEPVEEYWGFDYEEQFTAAYAPILGIEDPADPGTPLLLCDAIDRGLVHEVWIYGDADVPDVNAAEMLELKPHYDEDGNRLPGDMNRCAGNGCFDEEDVIPCSRSVRVAWFNNTRGPGCFLESMSHAFEGMGRKGWNILPYLSRYFPELASLQLDLDYGLGVADWYACPYGVDCLSYPTESSVTYAVSDQIQGTIDPYDPRCGSVHWAPNARSHYDLASPAAVRTSCTHWRDGTGQTTIYDGSQHQAYADLAPDCMGPFLVWWRQNIPGHGNPAIDDDGQPMHNFWPFMFY